MNYRTKLLVVGIMIILFLPAILSAQHVQMLFFENNKMLSSPFGANLFNQRLNLEIYSIAAHRQLSVLQYSVIDTAIILGIGDKNRFVYLYDSKANVTLSMREDSTNGQWYPIGRNIYAYDSVGNRISWTYGQWSNGQWDTSGRTVYTYDAHGNRILSFFTYVAGGQWLNSTRETFAYNLRDNIVSDSVELWNGRSWAPDSRYTYTYDSLDRITCIGYEDWDGSKWVPTMHTLQSYDLTGRVISYVSQVWSLDHWDNSSRESFVYTDAGNISSDIFEVWSTDQWVNSIRSISTYDEHHKLVSVISEKWSGGRWTYSLRRIVNNDTAGNIIEILHDAWTTGGWVPGNADVGLSESNGYYYYYSGYKFIFERKNINTTFVTSNPSYLPASFQLQQNYPNPFNPTTTISYELPGKSNVRLVLYNVLGQEVRTLVSGLQEAGSKSVQFEGGGLPSGIYFYRLDAANVSDPAKHFSKTRKMVLIK